jgi:hypothetical protein
MIALAKSTTNQLAPGKGSTHVPFGYSVAALVKSPVLPPEVSCTITIDFSWAMKSGNNTHRESEEMQDSWVKCCERKVEGRANVSLDIVHKERESVPALRRSIPKEQLAQEGNGSVVSGGIRKECG